MMALLLTPQYEPYVLGVRDDLPLCDERFR